MGAARGPLFAPVSSDGAGVLVILCHSVRCITNDPHAQWPETQAFVQLMNHGFLVVLWSWLDSHVWRLGACPWFPSTCPILQCAVGADRRRSPTQPELFRLLPASCLLTAPYRLCPRVEFGIRVGGHCKGETVSHRDVGSLSQQKSLWTQPVNVLPHHR